jgi:Protein of unknown function (DUF3987)/RepB DNA-primase from phage plasmid
MPTYVTFQDAVEHTEERRRDFFKLIFQNNDGYVCIAYKDHLSKYMDEEFFHYPSQLNQMCHSIDQRSQTLTHVYFCPQLLGSRDFRRPSDGKGPRVKENVKICSVLWADLDKCNPQLMQVRPSIVVQSSVGKFQAFWRLQNAMEPVAAQLICQRIAYFHADQGADKSGWDLTQLLRVPYTPNYKYGDIASAPLVVVTSTEVSLYRPSDFDCYPSYEALEKYNKPLPTVADLPTEDPTEILQRYRQTLNPQAFGLFSTRPGFEADGADWSSKLWRLEKLCIEAGMTLEEVYSICRDAACNKYKRDGRPDSHLWGEVSKSYIEYIQTNNLILAPTSSIPEFLSDEQVKFIQGRETFIERYIKWASIVTDASIQYHQASAFILLSSVLSNTVMLKTSFGNIIPNLWFLILADTTLTRKSTAMDLAWDLLMDTDPGAILATDGSSEGIMSALKDRENRSSIYFRDEFTGFLESIAHKDYMAGMSEAFTKLYDGKDFKRLLRREEIHVRNPRFLIYAGGIKSKTEMLLNDEHISSGFIPRFIFITADPDPKSIRPVGPPNPINTEARDSIKNELLDILFHYTGPRSVSMSDGSYVGSMKPQFEAFLSQDAWLRYNEFESIMTSTAIDSGLWHLTPVYDRLAKSTLKAAILIAGSTQREDKILVTENDINHAIYYCQRWRTYATNIVSSIGKSQDERLIDQIMRFIQSSRENGLTRAEIMKKFRMDSRKADLIFSTMTQRKLVVQIQIAGQSRYIEV